MNYSAAECRVQTVWKGGSTSFFPFFFWEREFFFLWEEEKWCARNMGFFWAQAWTDQSPAHSIAATATTLPVSGRSSKKAPHPSTLLTGSWLPTPSASPLPSSIRFELASRVLDPAPPSPMADEANRAVRTRARRFSPVPCLVAKFFPFFFPAMSRESSLFCSCVGLHGAAVPDDRYHREDQAGCPLLPVVWPVS